MGVILFQTECVDSINQVKHFNSACICFKKFIYIIKNAEQLQNHSQKMTFKEQQDVSVVDTEHVYLKQMIQQRLIIEGFTKLKLTPYIYNLYYDSHQNRSPKKLILAMQLGSFLKRKDKQGKKKATKQFRNIQPPRLTQTFTILSILSILLTKFKQSAMEGESQDIQQTLRNQALQRITIYTHPEIVLKHEPINAKQCEDLQSELREKIREKIEKVRREYEAENHNYRYDQVYSQFIKMTITNEAQQQAMCRDLQEMHEMAEILMNPPAFGKDLFLSSKQPPTITEVEQLKSIYDHYETLYKSGFTKQENEAEDAIKTAKKFILKEQLS